MNDLTAFSYSHMGDRRSNKICAIAERPDHHWHCGDDITEIMATSMRNYMITTLAIFVEQSIV